MLLNERSPLNAKIRTKSAELLMLRKIDAIEIYSLYPNIWKRINKISLHNMEQIYLKIRKYVIEFAKINKIDLNKILNKEKKSTNIKLTSKKVKFNEKAIHNAYNELKNSNLENKQDKNEKKINISINKGVKNNDIINVIQPTNINRNLIILNLPKTQNDLANLK